MWEPSQKEESADANRTERLLLFLLAPQVSTHKSVEPVRRSVSPRCGPRSPTSPTASLLLQESRQFPALSPTLEPSLLFLTLLLFILLSASFSSAGLVSYFVSFLFASCFNRFSARRDSARLTSVALLVSFLSRSSGVSSSLFS